MILMLRRDDQVIETFDSPENPPSGIEWIDVENGEYTFCDDRGQMYEGRYDHSGVLFFRHEAWHLVPMGKADPNNAMAIIESAVAVDSEVCAFPDLESLKRQVEKLDRNR
jgi:hypothetical protein